MRWVRRFLPSLVPAFGGARCSRSPTPRIEHVNPFHLTAIRYLLAAAGFLALLGCSKACSSLRFEGRGIELWAFGSAGIAGFNLFAFAGLEHTTPEHAALIVATQPADDAVGRRRAGAPRPAAGARSASC